MNFTPRSPVASYLDPSSDLAPGLVDNTAAISAALDAANAAGKYLRLPERDIVCGELTKSYAPRIIGNGARIIAVAGTPDTQALWNFTGSVGADLATTGTAAEGATVIPVPTATLAVGDLIIIGDEVAPAEATRYTGQQARVRSIDSGAQLTLWEPLYTEMASGSVVRKVTPLRRPTVKGLRFLNEGASDSGNYVGGLRLTYAENLDVEIDVEGNTSGGLILRDCYHGLARYRGRYGIWHQANGQYGYGVDVKRACVGLEVHSDCVANGPAVTTNGENGEYGEPLHNDFYVKAQAAQHYAASTHGQGRYNRFINPDVDKTAGFGIAVRARDTSIIGGSIRRTTEDSIYLNENCQGFTMRDCEVENSGEDAVFIQPAVVKSNIDIVNNIFSGLGRSGVRAANGLQDSTIKGNVIRGYAINAVSGEKYGMRFGAACTRTYVQENLIADPGGAAANDAILWTGTNVTCLSERNTAVNLPGAAAFPAATGVTASGNTDT